MFPTLGILKRMHNVVTLIWLAHRTKHASAVPVFLEGNYVLSERHTDISVEAWGGSNKRGGHVGGTLQKFRKGSWAGLGQVNQNGRAGYLNVPNRRASWYYS